MSQGQDSARQSKTHPREPRTLRAGPSPSSARLELIHSSGGWRVHPGQPPGPANPPDALSPTSRKHGRALESAQWHQLPVPGACRWGDLGSEVNSQTQPPRNDRHDPTVSTTRPPSKAPLFSSKSLDPPLCFQDRGAQSPSEGQGTWPGLSLPGVQRPVGSRSLSA